LVYELSDSVFTDYLYDDDDDVVAVGIDAVWIPMTIVRRNQILVKMVIANYAATNTTAAALNIEGLKIALPATESSSGEYAATDSDVAFLDTDPLVTNRSIVMRKRCQFVKWDITPRLEVTNGQFQVSTISMEIAEV
jgi:hypothetical protein